MPEKTGNDAGRTVSRETEIAADELAHEIEQAAQETAAVS